MLVPFVELSPIGISEGLWAQSTRVGRLAVSSHVSLQGRHVWESLFTVMTDEILLQCAVHPMLHLLVFLQSGQP